MDVQEKKAFEIAFDNKLGARGCQFDLDEDGNYEDRETLCGWHMWLEAKAQTDQKIKSLLCDEHLKKCESPTGIFNSQYPDEEPCLICLAKEAKAQAVPEWIDYSKQSPRIDGPYQIFIMNQQLVAEWESPWGFSSIEDGDALNQELITHWSVLGSDPVIEAQEPAND